MNKEKFTPTLLVDAKGAILGRLASFVSKQLLLGKTVAVLNCDEAVVSGDRLAVINQYKVARARGGPSLAGPHFPGSPERIVKRTVRGMLSYKMGRGVQAFKSIRCFNTIPNEFLSSAKVSLPVKEMKIRTTTLKEICKLL